LIEAASAEKDQMGPGSGDSPVSIVITESVVVGDIRGAGYMFGVELVLDRETRVPATSFARQTVQTLFQRGILAELGGLAGNVIRLLPPLNARWHSLRYAFGVLAEVIRDGKCRP
jgi:4-aminobutyrate aminotransferase-like enzyme